MHPKPSQKKLDYLYNKNSFLMTSNGLNFRNLMQQMVQEITNTISHLKDQDKMTENIHQKMKVYKILSKYWKLLLTWSETHYDNKSRSWVIWRFMNSSLENEDFKDQDMGISQKDPSKSSYWEDTLKTFEMKYQKMQESIKSKESGQNELGESSDRLKIQHQIPICEDHQFQDLRALNPHFSEVVKYFSPNMHFYLYLPTLMKVKLLGVVTPDGCLEETKFLLEIQLKVKMPCIPSHQIFEIFKKLNIRVFSGRSPREAQSSHFSQATYDNYNNDNEIWSSLISYYKQMGNWRNSRYSDVEEATNIFSEGEGQIIVYRTVIETNSDMISYDFHFPLDILDFNGRIEVQPIYTWLQEWDYLFQQYFRTQLNGMSPCIVIKLNLVHVLPEMNIGTQIYCKQRLLTTQYCLALPLMKLQISDKESSDYKLKNIKLMGYQWRLKKDKSQKSEQQQYDNKPRMYKGQNIAIFHFPFYRNPVNPMLSIFFTNIILGFVLFFVFYQDPQELGDVIANISALLISFVAVIAILQSHLRRNKMSVSSFMVYSVILTPIICLLNEMYLFLNEIEPNPPQSPLFWICVAINTISLIYLIMVIIAYKFCLEPKYNQEIHQQDLETLPGDKKVTKQSQNFISKGYQINKKSLITLSAFKADEFVDMEPKIKEFCQMYLYQSIVEAKQYIKRLEEIVPVTNKMIASKNKNLLDSVMINQANVKKEGQKSKYSSNPPKLAPPHLWALQQTVKYLKNPDQSPDTLKFNVKVWSDGKTQSPVEYIYEVQQDETGVVYNNDERKQFIKKLKKQI